MVGSYCIHRVELDTEPDDVLVHADGRRKNHKYVARVAIKDPKNPKKKWRYFYSREKYQAYLNREAKPGDRVQLPNGKIGVVGRDVAAPSTRNRYRPPEQRDTPQKQTKAEHGRGLLARLFGGGSNVDSGSNPQTEQKGNNVISNIFAKLAEHQARKRENDPIAGAINNFANAVKAKAEANAKAEAKKRKTKTPKPKTTSNQSVTRASSKDDEKKGKGSGGGGGGGSGKGSGGSGKGSGKADNASHYGSVDKLPKLKGDHTPDRDMSACGGDHDSSNCIAYDLRRRGYDVTPSDANFKDINAVSALYSGAQVAQEKDFNRLVAKLSKLKVGARGILQFGGRMVIWSMEKGGITFRDCTNGKELDQAKLSKQTSFQLIRTDNCSPKPGTLSAVKARS